MLKDFIKQAEQSSLFTVDIFDGQIRIRGRLLSPSESEAASLNSTLLISQIAPTEGKGLGGLQDLSKELTSDDVSQERSLDGQRIKLGRIAHRAETRRAERGAQFALGWNAISERSNGNTQLGNDGPSGGC